MVEVGVERVDQFGEGVVEAILVAKEDPVQLGQLLRRGAGLDLSRDDRDQPLALLRCVDDFGSADLRSDGGRAEHRDERVGGLDRLADLRHPLCGGRDAFPIDPALASGRLEGVVQLSHELPVLPRIR